MRIRSILAEAILNVRSGATAAWMFAIALASTLGGLGAADAVSVAAIEQGAQQFQRSGGSTLIYSAPGRIDGAACDSLADVRGVRAAGAMKTATKLAPATLAGSLIPAFTVSARFGGFTALGGLVAHSGVLISREVSETLGIVGGERIALVDGELDVGGVYASPADGRRPGYGYAVLIPAPSNQLFDQCWVEAWPQNDDIDRLLSLTVVSGKSVDETAPSLQQLNSSGGLRFGGALRFDERISRFAPHTGLVLAGVLGFLSVRRRRLQLASSRHAGVSGAALFLQTTTETLIWTVAGAIVVWAALVLASVWWPAASDAGASAALRVVASSGATVLGSAFATVTAREPHLFRYFKQR